MLYPFSPSRSWLPNFFISVWPSPLLRATTSPLDPKRHSAHCLLHGSVRVVPWYRVPLRPLGSLFQVKISTNVIETCKCGKAAITKKFESGYLEGDLAESKKKCHEGWFYIPDIKIDDPPRMGSRKTSLQCTKSVQLLEPEVHVGQHQRSCQTIPDSAGTHQ